MRVLVMREWKGVTGEGLAEPIGTISRVDCDSLEWEPAPCISIITYTQSQYTVPVNELRATTRQSPVPQSSNLSTHLQIRQPLPPPLRLARLSLNPRLLIRQETPILRQRRRKTPMIQQPQQAAQN